MIIQIEPSIQKFKGAKPLPFLSQERQKSEEYTQVSWR